MLPLRKTLVIISVLGVSTLTGCTKRPTAKAVEGTYIGHYADGTEIFHLRADGTFTQTFTGRSLHYAGRGAWSISGGSIVFDHFLSPFDGKMLLAGTPEQVDECIATWTPGFFSSQSIVLGDGSDDTYWINKQ